MKQHAASAMDGPGRDRAELRLSEQRPGQPGWHSCLGEVELAVSRREDGAVQVSAGRFDLRLEQHEAARLIGELALAAGITRARVIGPGLAIVETDGESGVRINRR